MHQGFAFRLHTRIQFTGKNKSFYMWTWWKPEILFWGSLNLERHTDMGLWGLDPRKVKSYIKWASKSKRSKKDREMGSSETVQHMFESGILPRRKIHLIQMKRSSHQHMSINWRRSQTTLTSVTFVSNQRRRHGGLHCSKCQFDAEIEYISTFISSNLLF